MSATNYLEDALLKHIFEGAAFTQPTEIWVGLSTADPGEDGTALDEPVGNGYLRVRPTDATGRWTIAEASDVTTAENKGDIVFPEASGAWGTLAYACIFDNGTDGQDGTLLMSFELDTPRVIGNGDALKIAAGDLVITLD